MLIVRTRFVVAYGDSHHRQAFTDSRSFNLWTVPFDACKRKIRLVNTGVVDSLQWWQRLAVLVGLVVIICSVTPLAMSTNQDKDHGVPVSAIGRMRVNWCASAHDGTNRASTSRVPTTIPAVDNLQLKKDHASPSYVDGRSVLDSSCSLRC